MTFKEYLGLVLASKKRRTKLSELKLQVLKELWGDGTKFPGDWVASSKLLAITGQKYFDRRIRELRDEQGCDVSTGTNKGGHAYRLESTTVNACNPRYYLSQKEKSVLFKRDNHTCTICGEPKTPGVRGLQADHKIPLIRGGEHSADNWQSICNVCNVGKRRACANCHEDCTHCPWAFPEKNSQTHLVTIPQDLAQKLEKAVAESGESINDAIVALLRKSL